MAGLRALDLAVSDRGEPGTEGAPFGAVAVIARAAAAAAAAVVASDVLRTRGGALLEPEVAFVFRDEPRRWPSPLPSSSSSS